MAIAPLNIPVYYFAYGSNMLTSRLVDRVGAVTTVGNAMLSGYSFRFNKPSLDGSGKANLVETKDCTVPGVLFQLIDKQLENLDKYEGAPNHYARTNVEVKIDSKTYSAITYLATSKYSRKFSIKPSDEYLSLIVEGAKEHYIPNTHVYKALASPKK